MKFTKPKQTDAWYTLEGKKGRKWVDLDCEEDSVKEVKKHLLKTNFSWADEDTLFRIVKHVKHESFGCPVKYKTFPL